MYAALVNLVYVFAGLAFALLLAFQHAPAKSSGEGLLRTTLVWLGAAVFAYGLVATIGGLWTNRDRRIPWSVCPALLILGVIITGACCDLVAVVMGEVRIDWVLCLLIFTPVVLFVGLVRRYRWAWYLTRWIGLLVAVGLFLFTAYRLLDYHERDKYGDVPLIPILLAGVVAPLGMYFGMFRCLNRPTARAYMGISPRKVRDHKWYQFGLSSLFKLTTVIALLLGAIVYHFQPFWQRRAAYDRLRSGENVNLDFNFINQNRNDNWFWTRFDKLAYGGEPVFSMSFFNFKKNPSDEDLRDIRTLSQPGWGIYATTTFPISDDELRRLLAECKIRNLTLKKPNVSHAGWAMLEGVPLLSFHIESPVFTDEDLLHLKLKPPLDFLVLRDTKVTGNLKSPDDYPKGNDVILDGSPITDDGLKSFLHIDIRSLSLSRSNVTGSGFNELENTPYLIDLDLSNSRLDDAGMAFLEKAKNIRDLDLSGCKISGKGLSHIVGHPRRLKLKDTSISDDDLTFLQHAGEFEELDLSGTKITGTGFRHLGEDASIRGLTLLNTNLSEEGLRQILTIKGLWAVHVDANTAAALNKIKSADIEGTNLVDIVTPPPPRATPPAPATE